MSGNFLWQAEHVFLCNLSDHGSTETNEKVKRLVSFDEDLLWVFAQHFSGQRVLEED